MREENITKIVFCTHQEQYEYMVMPFGLSNVSITFQAVMNNIFHTYLRWFVIIFFDDILVYGKNGEEYTQSTLTLSCRSLRHHLYVNIKKYFFQVEIEYLDHCMSTQGSRHRFIQNYCNLQLANAPHS